MIQITFNQDGTVDLFDEALGHGVRNANLTDYAGYEVDHGVETKDFIIVRCPVAGCGSRDYQPVSGGAAALMAHQLHLTYAVAKGELFAAAKARIAKRTAEIEPDPERFKFKGAKTLPDVATIADRAKAPPPAPLAELERQP